MLNKIKLVGKVSPIEVKEKEGRERRDLYFSLWVPNPSNALTILRCVAQGELAERVEQELKENDVVEVRGYLRNEKGESRQILTKVTEFNKLDINFDDIDKEQANQVRLIGKIITDFKEQENDGSPKVLSFKIVVPREGNLLPVFFCRAQDKEIISKIIQNLKKGDIIILEGFLQTIKKERKAEGEESEGATEKKFSRISSIICYGFTLLDNDSANVFNSLDNLTHIVNKVAKIDFDKPKEATKAA